MTTADLRLWAPSTTTLADDLVTEDEIYTGKHRKPGTRALSLLRMMYRPRHRAR